MIGIGYAAGNGNVNGSYSIYIGYGPQASVGSPSSETVIGNGTGMGSGTSWIHGTCYQGSNSSYWYTVCDAT